MKSLTLTIILLLLLPLSVFAQVPKTDRETDGLKGSVKSVVTEIANLKKTSKGKLVESNRRNEEAITYDSGGNRLTWKTYDYVSGLLFESVTYKRIDGDKVAVYEEVENPNKIEQIISTTEDSPANKADPRYSYKFKYKYDDNGNVSEEAWYHSNDALWLRYVYRLQSNQREELVYSADGSLNQKYVHTLDDKGNSVEMLAYDTESNKLESKETYEYLEFDAKGNWTKRITSEGDKKSKFVTRPREVLYRKLTYF
jgi:Txe/YoeB family toxin of Txe-Axe toxin-antitoxin module